MEKHSEWGVCANATNGVYYLGKLREIGYTAAQVSAIGPIPPREVRRSTDDHDIAICITHIPWQRLQKIGAR